MVAGRLSLSYVSAFAVMTVRKTYGQALLPPMILRQTQLGEARDRHGLWTR